MPGGGIEPPKTRRLADFESHHCHFYPLFLYSYKDLGNRALRSVTFCHFLFLPIGHNLGTVETTYLVPRSSMGKTMFSFFITRQKYMN